MADHGAAQQDKARTPQMRLLAVLLLHLSSSSEALQVRMSKRARSRARGKRQEGPQPQQLKQGIASVEVVRQNYARIHYHNGSSAEVHSPSLAQTQHGEWLAVRAALDITASEFAAARDAWKHATREELLRRKMGQGPKFTGNAATRFGLEMEPHAIALYERLTDSTVTPHAARPSEAPLQTSVHDVTATAEAVTPCTGHSAASPFPLGR